MKNFVATFFLCLLMVGCQATQKENTKQNGTEEVQISGNLENAFKGQEAADGFGGQWSWKTLQDSGLQGNGILNFEIKDGFIQGSSIIAFPVAPVAGTDANKDAKIAVLNYPIKGKVLSANKIEFLVKNNDGSVTKSIATLSQDGSLRGKSTQQTDPENNKKATYIWVANKL